LECQLVAENENHEGFIEVFISIARLHLQCSRVGQRHPA
jgi:hypothetical protein